ncbi:hypothetical protein L6249_01030 [Candidatus Parcubacteria bacterium]|nr:hypothetical protein [Patescibacteria group bacterium]MCG2690641.1 hypothetical protein [Candidatus Parcubacteria bacterium]
MICPKCNKETLVEWVYCPFCQNPLKKKCQECGQMELIGRPVCETKFAEIQTYTKKKVKKWRRNISALLLFLMCAPSALGISGMIASFKEWPPTILYLHKIFWLVAGIVSIVALTLPFGIKLINYWVNLEIRAEKQAEQEFFRLHPEYAEIIKKAEKNLNNKGEK